MRVTTTLQEEGRALGDPTRHEIFRYISAANGPVDVAEVTAQLGLNHKRSASTWRSWWVPRSSAKTTRRAPDEVVRGSTTGSPREHSRWGVTGPYERLSLLLTEMLKTGD